MNQPERPPKPDYEIGTEQATYKALQYEMGRLKEKLLNEPELRPARKNSIRREIVHLAFEQGFRKQEDEPKDEPFYLEAQRLSRLFFGEPQSEAAVTFDHIEIQDSETPAS